MLNDELVVVDVHTITDIVWVLDEEEDAAAEELGDLTYVSRCPASLEQTNLPVPPMAKASPVNVVLFNR